MGKLIDITGEKFGYLTALEYVGNGLFKCHCDLCEKTRDIWGPDLRRGRYKSCGCARRKKSTEKKETKAPAKQKAIKEKPEVKETPEQRKARKRAALAEKKNKKVDKSKPAGERHEPQLVVKNGKTYPKSSKVVLFQGDLRYLAELCEETGIKSAKVRDRLSNGWTVEQALELVERKKK